MKIEIGNVLSLYDKGKRARQEDYIMPRPDQIRENEKCYVVCDGLGGHSHGEIASRVVAENLYESLVENEDKMDADRIKELVDRAYAALDRAGEESGCRNMATTMACLCFNDHGYLCAHIGDSRIYHIRPSLYDGSNLEKCVLYKSFDHSRVNMLVKMGVITPEEAKTHPDRHILVMAMLPGMGDRRSHPFVMTGEDVKKGDYFLLCSDGVNVCVDDDLAFLRMITNPFLSDSQKIDRIDSICREDGDDNYSCWLIPVTDVAVDADETEITEEITQPLTHSLADENTQPL